MATKMVNDRDLVEILKNSGEIVKNFRFDERPYIIYRYCGKLFKVLNPYGSRPYVYEINAMGEIVSKR